MLTSNIAAFLTADRMFAKYTGTPDRPSPDRIARLAYRFYETRGRQDGQDVDDWLAAERELTRQYR